jgi:alanyl-tRNA synthetase
MNLAPTNKLYYQSAYLEQWQTSVIHTMERDGEHYAILKESGFYPHGGGQPCDTGTINGIPVVDVVAEGEVILHKVAAPLAEGEASCRLDWGRRFDHMQQHSGQHLLSAVCRSVCQGTTVSFHLGTDYATIDVDQGAVTPEQLAEIEREANRHIYLNHSMNGYFVTVEEAARLPLSKALQVTDNIRIVEMKDVEYNACGGTHVSSTGAIGLIKLLKAEKQKGNTRIYFKCGGRAMDEFNECVQILGALSARFNTGKEELTDRIGKWELEYKQLQAELAAVKEQNDSYLIRELLTQSEDGLIARLFTDKPLKDLQNLAAKLAAESGLLVLLATSMENKVVLAHQQGDSFHCGAYFKENLGAFGGKGGGSDKIAQAGFPDQGAALSYYEFASADLKK